MEFSRQEYRSALPFPSPGDLSKPGIEPASLAFPELAGGFFTTCALREVTMLRTMSILGWLQVQRWKVKQRFQRKKLSASLCFLSRQRFLQQGRETPTTERSMTCSTWLILETWVCSETPLRVRRLWVGNDTQWRTRTQNYIENSCQSVRRVSPTKMGESPEQALQRGSLGVGWHVNGCTASWLSRLDGLKPRWGATAHAPVPLGWWPSALGLWAGTCSSPAQCPHLQKLTPALPRTGPQTRGSGSQGPWGVEQLQRWPAGRFHRERLKDLQPHVSPERVARAGTAKQQKVGLNLNFRYTEILC